ncbi:ribosomal-processing cysteine protease Prp [Bacillus sp. FJAT-29814]|uniref:ribosomal-processing cysteine protease Prp n=1 Tax=Bacillus sp. FJAT-29814 TaxID=1729688 RepID=UPI00082A773E|nr:ribosomal-processing cysteine protease Prp [Bacillus sp. FJAT-29814]
MINITINRTEANSIQSFVISGHAFFSAKGTDIVCAGVSAVSVGAINAVHELTGVTPDIAIDHEEGFLRCVLPGQLPEGINEKVQLLLEGMIVSLRAIEEEYGEHIKITFKKREVD